jgi:hypothetical protein
MTAVSVRRKAGKCLVDVVSRGVEMFGMLAPAKLVIEAAVPRHIGTHYFFA